jgi:hypothetical protein
VRICTNRCRCHNGCRRSRFSGPGTQIRGKLFSRIGLSTSCASSRSYFSFFTRFALISAGRPIHTSKPNSASSRSNQRAYPVASMPTRTRIASCSSRSRAVQRVIRRRFPRTDSRQRSQHRQPQRLESRVIGEFPNRLSNNRSGYSRLDRTRHCHNVVNSCWFSKTKSISLRETRDGAADRPIIRFEPLRPQSFSALAPGTSSALSPRVVLRGFDSGVHSPATYLKRSRLSIG